MVWFISILTKVVAGVMHVSVGSWEAGHISLIAFWHLNLSRILFESDCPVEDQLQQQRSQWIQNRSMEEATRAYWKKK